MNDELQHEIAFTDRFKLYDQDHESRENELFVNEVIKASDEDRIEDDIISSVHRELQMRDVKGIKRQGFSNRHIDEIQRLNSRIRPRGCYCYE